MQNLKKFYFDVTTVAAGIVISFEICSIQQLSKAYCSQLKASTFSILQVTIRFRLS